MPITFCLHNQKLRSSNPDLDIDTAVCEECRKKDDWKEQLSLALYIFADMVTDREGHVVRQESPFFKQYSGEIISFISSLLLQAKKKERERLKSIAKKMKVGVTLVLGTPSNPAKINKTVSRHKTVGYDKALSDIIKLLENEK